MVFPDRAPISSWKEPLVIALSAIHVVSEHRDHIFNGVGVKMMNLVPPVQGVC